ncbi:MAG TPA: glycosyltransferase family 4 protein, partial [Streptosporangiaceae bacterium]|nr:glycosyltransferase family 4 protein [Streptosporangiaceae bacterium]
MKILAYPRDPNPYQRLLYSEMERLGAQVSYLGRLTPSGTLNLLLLPVETVARRVTGARLVHLHWVFGFSLPGGQRFRVVRRLGQAWFGLWLRVTKLAGLRLVWTAHNVLPHSPVFADDAAARRALVRRCDLVVAHSPAALAGLSELGATPRGASLVVRHGPMGPSGLTGPSGRPAPWRMPGSGAGPREFLFFGRVTGYKGVEELLAAFNDLAPGTPARLTVAGQCDDPGLRARLRAAERVRLRLERVPDRDVADLMAGADVVVLPFRQVTTSGSAELALSYGRPLIVPGLPGLAGLPDAAVRRYDGSVPGLTAAIADLAGADRSSLAAMSAAASA